MEPVSDQTRIAVWDTLCNLERNVRYYGALGDRFQRWHRRLRFGILAGVVVESALVYFATTK